MKKPRIFRFISIFLLVYAGIQPISAQETLYVKHTGDKTTDVLYSASKSGDVTKLFIEIGPQKSYHDIAPDGKTLSWHIVDISKQIDVLISLEGEIYHIRGNVKGKPVDKYEQSSGLPWYQNLAFICGKVVPAEGKLEYECFRPGEFTLQSMVANIVSDDGNESCVRVRPSGALASLWHADYYFSDTTRSLVGYRAVEGLPGTPVTTWTLKQ